MLMVCFSSAIIAQPANSNIPAAVTGAFNTKYPTATLKHWQEKKGVYTAKVIIDNHKYFAAFNKDGGWLSTASNIGWTCTVPKVVNEAYRKTNYNTWHVYIVKKVEKPTGEFYQLLVDDSNLHIGQHAEPIYTVKKLLEFKADGALAMVKDITVDPIR